MQAHPTSLALRPPLICYRTPVAVGIAATDAATDQWSGWVTGCDRLRWTAINFGRGALHRPWPSAYLRVHLNEAGPNGRTRCTPRPLSSAGARRDRSVLSHTGGTRSGICGQRRERLARPARRPPNTPVAGDRRAGPVRGEKAELAGARRPGRLIADGGAAGLCRRPARRGSPGCRIDAGDDARKRRGGGRITGARPVPVLGR